MSITLKYYLATQWRVTFANPTRLTFLHEWWVSLPTFDIGLNAALLLKTLFLATDMASIALGMTFVWSRTPFNSLLALVLSIGAIGFVSTNRAFNGYKSNSFGDVVGAVRGTASNGLLWVAVSVACVGYLRTHAAWIVLFGVGVSAFVAFAGRLVTAVVAARFWPTLAERVLLVGSRNAVVRAAKSGHLLNRRIRFAGGIFTDDPPGEFGLADPVSLEAGTFAADPAPDVFGRIDRVVIVQAGLDEATLSSAVGCLRGLAPALDVLEDEPGSHGGGIAQTCRRVQQAAISPGERLAKRAIDIVLSLATLFVLLPALFLVGLLIRLESSGPALFRQTRLGCNNMPFTVLKFRTMYAGGTASDGSVQTSRNDPRVTRFGRFLRKTSIDELPQLLNVLTGSMSLVGPRPHPTRLNQKFEPIIPNYRARHRVRPGITGLAQVSGYRGETPTAYLMQRRVDFDLDYIRRQSVGFDLWIMMRTVCSVIIARNVY